MNVLCSHSRNSQVVYIISITTVCLVNIPTIIQKIFGTNSSFHAEQRTVGKGLISLSGVFLLVLTKFLFDRGTGH